MKYMIMMWDGSELDPILKSRSISEVIAGYDSVLNPLLGRWGHSEIIQIILKNWCIQQGGIKIILKRLNISSLLKNYSLKE